ncbi:MAG: FAD binding domain-containing protein [Sulfitobacter sp.]
MTYTVADSLDQVLDLIGAGTSKLVAGGTDFFPAKPANASLGPIVDVSRVDGLRNIQKTPACWRIGAAVSWSALIKHDFPAAFDGLKAAAREVGSVQIQNTGTIAGNLCNASPAADGVPALMALDACVELQSKQATRLVPLPEFIKGVRQTDLKSNELLTAIVIPHQPPHVHGYFQKLGSRRYMVISITMVGAVIGVDDLGKIDVARIAIGACAPVAKRQFNLEAQVIGQRPADVSLTPDDLQDLSPIEDVRGDASYRMLAAAEQVTRILRSAAR